MTKNHSHVLGRIKRASGSECLSPTHGYVNERDHRTACARDQSRLHKTHRLTEDRVHDLTLHARAKIAKVRIGAFVRLSAYSRPAPTCFPS